ncbi:hypothetical protein IT408_04675 [Candidatus Uhrbacteria bacterium]|nr:hypothetical protein [Candidatus Uhrbacteria bacterium]
MAELSKKPVRRVVRKAAHSPVPEGMNAHEPSCGHGGCGVSCSVRYVGPTSHVRDHHIFHTARGVGQVWTAAIVAGLAVVLTGAIAWSTVDAQSRPAVDTTNSAIRQSVEQLGKRLDRIEEMLKMLTSQCKSSAAACADTTGGAGITKTDPNVCYERCVAGGENTSTECRKSCGQTGGETMMKIPSVCEQKCSTEAAICKRAATDIDKVANCGDLYKRCTSSCK